MGCEEKIGGDQSGGEMMRKTIDPALLSLFPVVDCIADILGPNTEVVLHRLDDLEHSIVKIRNGNVTQRKVGDGMTDLGLEMIKEARKGLETLGNYRTCSKDGRFLKCNAATIKDGNRRIVGFLCINMDISQLLEQAKAADAFCLNDSPGHVRGEKFGTDLNSILQNIINDVIKTARKPVHRLSKEDRLSVVSKLRSRGVFFAKGSIEKVTTALGISVPCLYKYLKETSPNSRDDDEL
jgi:predicted transcriptional regulator YheO